MSNIKDILVLNERAIAVKVPQDAKDFDLQYSTHFTNDDVERLVFSSEYGGDMILLPPGSWSILGMSDKLTDDDWKKVVDWYTDSNDSSYDPQYNETTHFDVYKDYTTGDEGELDTATESGLSLLKSKGIEVPHLILINNG